MSSSDVEMDNKLTTNKELVGIQENEPANNENKTNKNVNNENNKNNIAVSARSPIRSNKSFQQTPSGYFSNVKRKSASQNDTKQNNSNNNNNKS